MSGNFSRNKGRRREYELRDHLRQLGFVSNRVPSSGAAEGFKGDVTYERDSIKGVCELKARKDAFREIYSFYDKEVSGGLVALIVQPDTVRDKLVLLTDSFIIASSSIPGEAIFKLYPEYKKVSRKIANLEKLKQSCDLLVVKDDFKKFLFLRYL